MKSTFTLLFLALCFNVSFAQVTLNEAPDITVTDIHGHEHNLYSILDQGQYVMIDLFAYWCGPCCATAPSIKQTYEDYGCNTGALFVLGLEADGTTAQTEAFENDCGSAGAHPVASGLDGGASDAVDAFGPAAYPTIILVAPDRTIIEKDIWPYTNTDVDAIMAGLGIDKQECITTSNEEIDLVVSNMAISPNPVTDFSRLNFNLAETADVEVSIVNMTGQLVQTVFSGTKNSGVHQMDINSNDLAQGTYFVKLTLDGANTKSIKMMKID